MLNKHHQATAVGQNHSKNTLEIKECKQFLGITCIDLFINKQEQQGRQRRRGACDVEWVPFHSNPSPNSTGGRINHWKERGWRWQANALLLKDRAHAGVRALQWGVGQPQEMWLAPTPSWSCLGTLPCSSPPPRHCPQCPSHTQWSGSKLCHTPALQASRLTAVCDLCYHPR